MFLIEKDKEIQNRKCSLEKREERKDLSKKRPVKAPFAMQYPQTSDRQPTVQRRGTTSHGRTFANELVMLNHVGKELIHPILRGIILIRVI